MWGDKFRSFLGTRVLYCSTESRCMLLRDSETSSDDAALSVWNLITNETIKLPPIDIDHSTTARLFEEPDCCWVLLFIKFYSIFDSLRPMYRMMYVRVNVDEDWRMFDYDPDSVYKRLAVNFLISSGDDFLQLTQPVFLNGEIYALHPRQLNQLVNIRFDGTSESFTTNVMSVRRSPFHHVLSALKYYLVIREDKELYLVTLSKPKTSRELPEIKARRFDFAKRKWVKVGSSLKGWKIFLGSRYSFFWPAVSSEDKKWTYLYFDNSNESSSSSVLKYRMEDERIVCHSRLRSTSLWLPCWLIRLLSPVIGKTVNAGSGDCTNNAKRCKMAAGEGFTRFDMLPEDLLGLIAEKVVISASAVDCFQFGRVIKIAKYWRDEEEESIIPALHS